ncbi:hypothetical protein FOA52_007644 [Chlamydomonas sp. UWO 241]|nr:hypothetical protein FOA52_007644 [Chlamydomonas sp. UWO 241]
MPASMLVRTTPGLAATAMTLAVPRPSLATAPLRRASLVVTQAKPDGPKTADYTDTLKGGKKFAQAEHKSETDRAGPQHTGYQKGREDLSDEKLSTTVAGAYEWQMGFLWIAVTFLFFPLFPGVSILAKSIYEGLGGKLLATPHRAAPSSNQPFHSQVTHFLKDGKSHGMAEIDRSGAQHTGFHSGHADLSDEKLSTTVAGTYEWQMGFLWIAATLLFFPLFPGVSILAKAIYEGLGGKLL